MRILILFIILFSPLKALCISQYGRWNYTIYSENNPIGKTTITRNLKDGIITTNSRLKLNSESLIIISSETIKETTKYSPVSLSSNSTIIDNKKINRSYIYAKVSDNIISVTGLDINLKLRLQSDLIFGTNKVVSDAIISKFNNRISEYTIYDPSSNSKNIFKLKVIITPNLTIMNTGKNITVNKIQIFTRTDHKSPLLVMEIYCDNNGLIYMYKINLDNKPLEFILDK